MGTRRLTYQEGEYSQVQFPDGSRLYVETLPEVIRAKNIRLGAIPTSTVWIFNFPFIIRTVNEPWRYAKEALELTLAAVENCFSSKEAAHTLQHQATEALRKYVEENRVTAYFEGMRRLGDAAVKRFKSSAPHDFDEAMKLAQYAIKVGGAFEDRFEAVGGVQQLSRTLEELERHTELASTGEHAAVRPTLPAAPLPYDRDTIRAALKMMRRVETDPQVEQRFAALFLALDLWKEPRGGDALVKETDG